jgi:6-phosphogluconolactonase (cycloisomerase 2 family)
MLLGLILSFFSFFLPDSSTHQLIVGSYTQSGNPGLEVFDVNISNGRSKKAYELVNPNASYQHLSKDGKFLFSVTEEAGKSAVSSYRRKANGEFERISSGQTIGLGPCFVVYREASKTLYTANYAGGSLSVFKTDNGKILPISQHIKYTGTSVHPTRQNEAHAHMTILSPDQTYLFVTDLGTDKIYRHKILADGTVEENFTFTSIPAGQGPRHLTFNTAGTKAYLINELKGLVNVFSVKNNELTQIQTLVADTTRVPDKGSADIHISPNGKWVISSNRVSSNQVTVFAVQANGTLKLANFTNVGRKPRNFSFDPSGRFVYVACQDDHKVQVWAFNNQTGTLTDTHQDIAVKAPVCLHFIKKR